jgi:hypothetical protein
VPSLVCRARPRQARRFLLRQRGGRLVVTGYLILLLLNLAYNLICNVYNVSNPIQSMQFTLNQRLQIGTLLAADMMRCTVGRASQAG